MTLEKQQQGEAVVYELGNDRGISVKVTNYGCTILSIVTPGKNGEKRNIVAGFDTVAEYIPNPDYLGCIVGRCTSRTSGAALTIDGQRYFLSANKGKDHLHGGTKGLDQRYWTVEEELRGIGGVGVVFGYVSPDGEEGYPGNLSITVGYYLDNENKLTLRYRATTDKTTPVNLTNHSYFNLTGFEEGSVMGHLLKIDAGKYTPLSEALVPSGAIEDVAGSALDFRQPMLIGLRAGEVPGESYDHNFVLDNITGQMGLAAELVSPLSGRVLKVFTDQPCLGVYTSGYLDGSRIGTQGKRYQRNGAICLETQRYPDAVNRPEFPTTLVWPGAAYMATTVFEFGVR
ncbi:MAG: galactose mutarotase [Chitinophagaceae bacterium]|nr:galactose mutarotase [Chitinophagaceae bacterium]